MTRRRDPPAGPHSVRARNQGCTSEGVGGRLDDLVMRAHDPRLAFHFRPVHGAVSRPYEAVGLHGIEDIAGGDPDAGGKRPISRRRREGSLERLEHPDSDVQGTGVVDKVLTDDDELVTTETTHRVRWSDARRQALGYRRQDEVADTVSEPVRAVM